MADDEKNAGRVPPSGELLPEAQPPEVRSPEPTEAQGETSQDRAGVNEIDWAKVRDASPWRSRESRFSWLNRFAPWRTHQSRLTIVGAGNSGKSYVFRGMVASILAASTGPLGFFLRNARPRLDELPLRRVLKGGAPAAFAVANLDLFLEDYLQWRVLSRTTDDAWNLYRLVVDYRDGLLERSLVVQHMEYKGEWSDARRALSSGFFRYVGESDIIAVVLPAWAVWPTQEYRRWSGQQPDPQLRPEYHRHWLQDFRVSVEAQRANSGVGGRIRWMFLLSQFDSPNHNLAGAREKWVRPFMESLMSRAAWRTGAGAHALLRDVGRWSQHLGEALALTQDPRLASLLDTFAYGNEPPVLLPVSAFDGARMNQASQSASALDQSPVPVNCEVPILLGLAWDMGIML